MFRFIIVISNDITYLHTREYANQIPLQTYQTHEKTTPKKYLLSRVDQFSLSLYSQKSSRPQKNTSIFVQKTIEIRVFQGIFDTRQRFSKIVKNLERKKKEEEIDLRTPKSEMKMRAFQGIFGTRRTMSSAETQSGAKGNFRVEILLHSWQPTFTRFLQRARLMAQERRYSRRRLLYEADYKFDGHVWVGTKAWATFGQRPNTRILI